MEGTGTIIIENFTKQFLNDTVPAHSVDHLILPKFKQPQSNGGVGCQIQANYFNWTLITQEKVALDIVQNGYKPHFKSKPPLVKNPEPHEYDLSEIQKEALDIEVQHFLDQNVIEPVNDLNSPGYYSCLFVRPRSNDSPNKWRCIFDISNLNKYILAPKFRMESTSTVRNFLKLNNYAVKLDLSDAFLHVPLHKNYRKYMRFFHRGRPYQFKSICFGANFSPYVFSYLINVVMKYFHKLNIDICAYLDDMLGQNPVPSTIKSQIKFVVQVMTHLGWTVNFDKSILDPTQLMDYIGLHIDFQLGMVYPPQDRWDKIQTLCKQFLNLNAATAKLWCSLLGLLTSCQDLTFFGRLWLRPIQLHLNNYWKNRKNLFQIIPVTQTCKEAIQWWTYNPNVMKGVPWTHPPPQLTIFTDSSNSGWGGTLENQTVSGIWTHPFIQEHINLKEMAAVEETLKYFKSSIQNKSIMIASDNSSTVSYLNKLGGTKSQSLLDKTVDILLWCKDHNITLRARHIPGRYNVISDQLSRRGQIISTEWSIHPSVINQIAAIWEKPHIDMFATRYNAKLNLYYSPVPDPKALAVDALAQSWENTIGYAYPPQALLQRVLNKINQENCIIYLVAPAWSSRSWYPSLLNLLIDHPRRVNPSRKLLKQPISSVYHQNPAQLNLHVWKLSRNTCWQKAFQNLLPKASARDVDKLQINCMRPAGDYMLVGVINGKSIRSKLLNNN